MEWVRVTGFQGGRQSLSLGSAGGLPPGWLRPTPDHPDHHTGMKLTQGLTSQQPPCEEPHLPCVTHQEATLTPGRGASSANTPSSP